MTAILKQIWDAQWPLACAGHRPSAAICERVLELQAKAVGR